MRTLVLIWASLKVLRAVVAIAVIALVGLVLLSLEHSVARSSNGFPASIEHAVRPLERELQRTLEKGLKP